MKQGLKEFMLNSTGGKDEKAKSGVSLTQNLEPGAIMVGLESILSKTAVPINSLPFRLSGLHQNRVGP